MLFARIPCLASVLGRPAALSLCLAAIGTALGGVVLGEGQLAHASGEAEESEFPDPPLPEKPGGAARLEALRYRRAAVPPVVRTAEAQGRVGRGGALLGKTIYLSAGHGFESIDGNWGTQRPNTNNLVEDLITIEGVNQYLIPYLQKMGAYVVPIREADFSSQRFVVDDDVATLEGEAMGAEPEGSGWAPFTPPIAADVLPFSRGQTRSMPTADEESGRAVYFFQVEKSGLYNVYVSWLQGENRAPDAHVVVRHGGGETHFRVDQRRHGSTWVLLGRFYFEAKAPLGESSLVFLNDSEHPGTVVSFDAVRVGGGMAPFDLGGGEIARPMFELAARHSTQLLGAPSNVFANEGSSEHGNDVASRPRFSAWDHEDGEDAIYLAWHTNAPNPARGTSTYSYGSSDPNCSSRSEFAGVDGSLELQDAVHQQLIGDLRAEFDSEWEDDGMCTAWFGEVSPNHNSEMPALLVELAFHDTPADADALREPHFRRISARAMARGVAKYFAERDGNELVLPPEPPRAVQVTNDGEGGLLVSWQATEEEAGGDEATGYRVQVSTNGYGFDEGNLVEGTQLVLDGLEVGDVRYVRVVAVNQGGESLPSEVVGARVSASGKGTVLVVGGFDRLIGAELPQQDLTPYGLGIVDRMFVGQVNDGSYAVRHGAAIAEAGFSFDGATDDAIEGEQLVLDDYLVVDWFFGEDGAGDDPLPKASRDLLRQFIAGGGHVLLSGSNLVASLAEDGAGGDQDASSFLASVLHVELVADVAVDPEDQDEGPYDSAIGSPEGDWSSPYRFGSSEEGHGTYEVQSPDALAPKKDAIALLHYGHPEPSDVAAAVGYGKPGEARTLVVGFPFEMVDGPGREVLIAKAMAFFDVEEPLAPIGTEPDEEGGCGCRTGSPSTAPLAQALLFAALGLLFTRRRRVGDGSRGDRFRC